MSSFLAPSYLTCPFSCFLANEIPPDGATEAAAAGLDFLPSCIVPLACGAVEFTGTEIA